MPKLLFSHSLGRVFGGGGETLAVAWAPDSRRLAIGRVTNTFSVHDVDTGQPLWTAVLFNDGEATLSPECDLLHGEPSLFEKEFVYVVESPEGVQAVVGPSDFRSLARQGGAGDASSTPQ